MQATDRKDFTHAMTALASAFRSEADEAFFEGYWMALDDLSIATVRSAVRRAVRECKFMPSARELRDLAGEVGVLGRAMIAWNALQRAISMHGYYATVKFDDPFTTAVVRHLGGWQAICEKPSAELDNFVRRDFEKYYAAFWQSGIASDQASPLLGFFARENTLAGYEAPKPVEIVTGLPVASDRIRLIGGPRGKSPTLPALENFGKMPEDSAI